MANASFRRAEGEPEPMTLTSDDAAPCGPGRQRFGLRAAAPDMTERYPYDGSMSEGVSTPRLWTYVPGDERLRMFPFSHMLKSFVRVGR